MQAGNSLEDIGEGIKELQRAAKIGLRGAMIWGAPPREKPYTSKEYDAFWACAQDLQMPLSLHVITGKKPPKSEDQTPVLRMLRGAARGVPADAHRRHLGRKYR